MAYSLLLLGEIGLKLLERAAPALRHAGAAVFKRLALFGARVVRRPVDRQFSLAVAGVLKGEDREQLDRPGRRHRMPGDAGVLIRERAERDDTFLRHDLPEHPLTPYRHVIRSCKAVVMNAARPQIELRDVSFEAFRAEPLLEAVRLGEGRPDQLARRVKRAADDERLDLLIGHLRILSQTVV